MRQSTVAVTAFVGMAASHPAVPGSSNGPANSLSSYAVMGPAAAPRNLRIVNRVTEQPLVLARSGNDIDTDSLVGREKPQDWDSDSDWDTKSESGSSDSESESDTERDTYEIVPPTYRREPTTLWEKIKQPFKDFYDWITGNDEDSNQCHKRDGIDECTRT